MDAFVGEKGAWPNEPRRRESRDRGWKNASAERGDYIGLEERLDRARRLQWVLR